MSAASQDLMAEYRHLPAWAQQEFWFLIMRADSGDINEPKLIEKFGDLFQRAKDQPN